MNARPTAFASLLGAATACAFQAIAGAVSLPMPWYEPLENAFRFGRHHSSVAMDWYSRCAISFILGTVVFSVVRAWSRRHEIASSTFRLAVGWAVLAFLLVAGFYGWTLNGRRALPEPLPIGYQAR